METKRWPLYMSSTLISLIIAAHSARADFIQIEQLLQAPARSLAEKLGDVKVVVAVRNGARRSISWNVGQAAGVELTAALRRHHVDAIRAAADTRFDKLEASD